jgi:hypothetical protein
MGILGIVLALSMLVGARSFIAGTGATVPFRRAVSVRMGGSLAAEVEDTVYASLCDSCGVRPGDRLLLCVSGGVDSMAMLHAVARVRSRFSPPLQVDVAHFNHKQRSASDEVQNLHDKN